VQLRLLVWMDHSRKPPEGTIQHRPACRYRTLPDGRRLAGEFEELYTSAFRRLGWATGPYRGPLFGSVSPSKVIPGQSFTVRVWGCPSNFKGEIGWISAVGCALGR
jgi:hypothetical protein